MRTPEHDRWFHDRGDQTLRLTYPLNKYSVVFDVGGYEGNFVSAIHAKYSCRVFVFEPVPAYFDKLCERFKNIPEVTVIKKAISSKCEFRLMSVSGDCSGFFAQKKENVILVECITLEHAMQVVGVSHVNLLKLNIEGAEYEVLEQLIQTNLVKSFDAIQVQFHTCLPDYMDKHAQIQKKLQETHEIGWEYPFVWTNYNLKIK